MSKYIFIDTEKIYGRPVGKNKYYAMEVYLRGERACSLVVTRVSVAPQVLSSTPCGSEFLRI
jgi:hypothetical protein